MQTAALILAVGEDDHGLTADFFRELVVRSQVNRIVEQRSFRSAGGGERAAAQSTNTAAASTCIDLGAVQRLLQAVNGAGEVLQKIDVHIEADYEGFVLFTQDFAEEVAADFLFHIEHARLAAAGVDQDAEGEREIGFGGEIFDGLGLAVFRHLEVVLRQAGDEAALFVLHIEKQLDDIDIDLERVHGLIFGLVVGFGLLRRVIGRACQLRHGLCACYDAGRKEKARRDDCTDNNS